MDIKHVCRYALITGGSDNSLKFPTQQVSYLERTADCAMLFPYGFFANATPNEDCLVNMFSMGGVDDSRLGMPYNPLSRPRDLEPGEVAFYHPDSDTFIKLRNNGDLELTTGNDGTGNVIINCNDANINVANDVNLIVGNDAVIDVGNDLTVDAVTATVTASTSLNLDSPVTVITASTSLTIDTPLATFTGDVQVDGDLDVTQDFNLTGDAALGVGGLAIARTTDTTDGAEITGGSSNHTAT